MGKVNVPRNDLQWIAQAFDLALAGISRKQVKLQGTSGLGHGGHRWDVDSRFEGWGFLEVPDEVKAQLYDKGQGTAKDAAELGAMAHTRGMVISMLQVEAIRVAQEKYGKGKVMTPEQVRWGFENLNLTQARLNELGFGKILRPVQTSCSNHLGTDWARVAQWDGSGWKVVSDWYQADKSMVEPLVKEYGEKYAKEKNVKMRTCN